MEPEVATTFVAAVDTILPASSDAGVHARVWELFEHAMPGYGYMVHALLDGFAAEERTGASFADLNQDERGRVFIAMISDDSIDVRDVVDGLFLFTLGQNYAETHPDREKVWRTIGYHGPSEGEPLDA
ncbi:MAG: hypothetical protein ABIS18_03840 [Actinomycetota bacterium]